MGRNYSFDLWVPRARLYHGLTAVAHRDNSAALDALVWPDGRHLPGVSRRAMRKCDPIPIEFSHNFYVCLSFAFAPDEALLEYDKLLVDDRAFASSKRADGCYDIGCIWMGLSDEPHEWEWLEGEADLVQLYFQAAGNRMSDLFWASESVQQWFIELAREVGAFSCALDYEAGFKLLYLGGEVLSLDCGQEQVSPFHLARLAGRPQSAAAKRLSLFEIEPDKLTAHEQLERLLAERDANSGVRGKALKSLQEPEIHAEGALLRAALTDADWRLRALAASLLWNTKSAAMVEQLEAMLQDVDPQVRIAAVKSLGSLELVAEKRLQLAFETPVIAANLGLIYAALMSFEYGHEEIWQRALETPDYPFVRTAAEQLQRIAQQRARER